MPKKPIEVRFWAKVRKTESCWFWTAGTNEHGYGVFSDWVDGKNVTHKAHRLAYVLMTGEDIDGKHLDHTCHTPLCVNPNHLRPTTVKQNMENRAGPNANSSSGVRGVHWASRYQKWEVQVKHNGRSRYFGRYETLEEAEAVAIARRNEFFTHNDGDRAAA